VLVAEQQAKTKTGERINWGPIGKDKELNRIASVCQKKWKQYQYSLLAQSWKKGAFSPEEDATIVARVAAWDTKDRGLWTGLERELGRAAMNINNHWRYTLSKR
jgi:hypothetical protein